MGALLDKSKAFYANNYRYFLIFTAILLLALSSSLVLNWINTGSFVNKGASLTGGVSVRFTVAPGFDVSSLRQNIPIQFPNGDITVREVTSNGVLSAVIVEAAFVDGDDLVHYLEGVNKGPLQDSTVEEYGAALSSAFYGQAIRAMIMAFLFMAIVVYITFRDFVPSLFVILAVVSTMISTMATTNLLGIKLGTSGIAAILMLIGYSVDTDILLTTRVLKRRSEGTIVDQTFSAMRTGITLTLTSITSVVIGLIFTNSDVVAQICQIIAIGLVYDIIYTWLQNAVILRWHLERLEKKQEVQNA